MTVGEFQKTFNPQLSTRRLKPKRYEVIERLSGDLLYAEEMGDTSYDTKNIMSREVFAWFFSDSQKIVIVVEERK